MPAVNEAGFTVIAVADDAVLASFHHWARYPVAPQPEQNSPRYLPGGRPVSA
jgi:hypothetical protein